MKTCPQVKIVSNVVFTRIIEIENVEDFFKSLFKLVNNSLEKRKRSHNRYAVGDLG